MRTAEEQITVSVLPPEEQNGSESFLSDMLIDPLLTPFPNAGNDIHSLHHKY